MSGTASPTTSKAALRSSPGPGEVLIRVTAAGVNFVDISQARGTFAGGPQPPYLTGTEGAGEVTASAHRPHRLQDRRTHRRSQPHRLPGRRAWPVRQRPRRPQRRPARIHQWPPPPAWPAAPCPDFKIPPRRPHLGWQWSKRSSPVQQSWPMSCSRSTGGAGSPGARGFRRSSASPSPPPCTCPGRRPTATTSTSTSWRRPPAAGSGRWPAPPPAWSETRGPGLYTRCGPAFAATWAIVMGTRVAVIWALQDAPWFAHTAGSFLRDRQIGRSAIAAAFVLTAVIMYGLRFAVIAVRARQLPRPGALGRAGNPGAPSADRQPVSRALEDRARE